MAFALLALVALGPTIFVAMGQTFVASGQTQSTTSAEASTAGLPTSDEIVQQLVEHNRERAALLKGYTDERHYTVTYHGFPAGITASMVAEATYDAPTTKRFRIISQSGSKLLAKRVLTRLLDSEKEAALEPDKTALTPANYTFSLLGQQTVGGRKCYVLHVEPKAKSKFLYRGKIYVDAEEYAVAQIDVEPAQNPSFLIRRTKVHHVYGKTGQFWLPEHDRSETALRFGGTAVLTIDYGTYHVR